MIIVWLVVGILLYSCIYNKTVSAVRRLSRGIHGGPSIVFPDVRDNRVIVFYARSLLLFGIYSIACAVTLRIMI